MHSNDVGVKHMLELAVPCPTAPHSFQRFLQRGGWRDSFNQ